MRDVKVGQARLDGDDDRSLAARTTLRLGGPARHLVTVDREKDAVEAVRDADADSRDVLVLGGGSNLVVADTGFEGTVVHMRTRGVTRTSDNARGHVLVTAQAGEAWDDFVTAMVGEGLVGVECLAGIPGLV